MIQGSFFRQIIGAALLVVGAMALAGVPAHAADNDAVPYWASLRAKPVNMHVGPGEDYRTNFRYHREDLPMKVLRKMEGWRLVEDPEGARGWMLARFLKPERGAIVLAGKGEGGLAEMRASADPEARLLWRLEPGVTGKLGDCVNAWCKFEVGGHGGYVREEALWGVGNP
ncbi:MAG TPA: SH3 domain-containing protein [Novosphingobium sp.]|nr:SH3 domain-containing protein [Novosphingobium sp.]